MEKTVGALVNMDVVFINPARMMDDETSRCRIVIDSTTLLIHHPLRHSLHQECFMNTLFKQEQCPQIKRLVVQELS
ncbi:hypothetical protein [Undibacterium sp. WLHG33]|uniref:hypothetical protein n=1 Tax=Undibacterium sp. WLHG33 TaxID=3412482 RepID=UPI003C2AB886